MGKSALGDDLRMFAERVPNINQVDGNGNG